MLPMLFWGAVLESQKDFNRMCSATINTSTKALAQLVATSDPIKAAEIIVAVQGLVQEVVLKGLVASQEGDHKFFENQLSELTLAIVENSANPFSDAVEAYWERTEKMARTIATDFPDAVKTVEAEFGFHPEKWGCEVVDMNEFFTLYQVLPFNGAKIRRGVKPLLILHPYVLGHHILSFLPGDNRSYVHAFANEGIPTYFRVLKNIDTTPAVQTMTGEDDVRSTRRFCLKIANRHCIAPTLNGYCQGGFLGMLGFVSGELDGVADALITAVAPADGYQPSQLSDFVRKMPDALKSLAFATKTLANGNQVIDGQTMSFMFSLMGIEGVLPLLPRAWDGYVKASKKNGGQMFDKAGAATALWLTQGKKDLPPKIAELSLLSYTRPISEDGTLPIKLFGEDMNINHFDTYGIPWLVCRGSKDGLIGEGSARVPVKKLLSATESVFPGGHGVIATVYPDPNSTCPLNGSFEVDGRTYVGPVKWQLDLSEKGNFAGAEVIGEVTRIHR